MGYVYCITNVLNGKKYVGITTRSIERRFSEHLDSADPRSVGLHGAIAKHGVASFSATLLEVVDDDGLCEREQHWIAELGTFGPNGYNLTTGGEAPHRLTPELIELISARTREAMDDPNVRALISRKTREAQADPEVRRKMLDNQRAAMQDPVLRKHLSAVQSNRSAEWQAKMTSSLRLTMARPDVRGLVSTRTREAMTPDVINKVSSRTREAMKRPEVLAKLVAAKSKRVRQFTVDGTFVKEFSSAREASEVTGVNRGNICTCARGETRQAGGFTWYYF